jgi:hypothetical protein
MFDDQQNPHVTDFIDLELSGEEWLVDEETINESGKQQISNFNED